MYMEREKEKIKKTLEAYVFLKKWGSEGSRDGQFGVTYSYFYKVTDETIENLKDKIDKEKLEFLKSLKNKEEMDVFEFSDAIVELGFIEAKEHDLVCNESISRKIGYGPSDIAVDNSRNIYVLDKYNGRIQKFDSEGNFITKWISWGNDDKTFRGTRGILVSPEGYVYIGISRSQIIKLDPGGNFITTWGSFGDDEGQLYNPLELAVNSKGYVYVVDCHRYIQKFDSEGNFIERWLEIVLPYSSYKRGYYNIAIDKSDYVYLAFRQKNEIVTNASSEVISVGPGIVKFSSSGEFITEWDNNNYGLRIGGITTDSENNVFVTDKFDHRIQKFSSSGKFITEWGKKGSGEGEFLEPKGIAVDSKGNVYVMDTGNYRIQKFAPNPDFNPNN